MNQEKIKVLFLEPSGDSAGVSIFIKRIVEYIDTAKFDVSFLSPSKNNFTDSLSKLGVHIISESVGSSPSRGFLENILTLRKLFKKEQYDAIYAHTLKGGIVSALALLWLPTKLVYSSHG